MGLLIGTRGNARSGVRVIDAEPLFERTSFNDPALVAEGLCTRLSGHDDHVHVEIHPPVRRGGTGSPLPLVEADDGERP